MIMENYENFKGSRPSVFARLQSGNERELLERLINENQELRQLACPFSEDCLSVEDYVQKREAFERSVENSF
jgi:hypothetical protein